MEENTKKGGISVEVEHIFPVIKRWLYSEKEIFLREIVSNASDAVTKLKRLSSLGEVRDLDDNFRISVTVDKENRTLTVSDNGIGMTEEEVMKYICQIALSGAVDFIAKYDSEGADGAKDGIIGHFGLGFYSAFMVSEKVTVLTRSYTGTPAVKWECGEDGDYELTPNYDKESRGTDVIMHINDDETEYLEESKIREILDKYCAFMPVPIYLEIIGKEKQDEEPINDTQPLWQKNPSDCTEEEYKAFYKKVFHDYKDPLFYIHINADYPLNFKGILYFPKLNHEYDSLEGQVKLYYNQVFVADNIKEVIPEFLLMLKGVVDCPELPLNVSRSYLQNSGYVAKISAHIVKKVADKLNSLFSQERERYQTLWGDIKPFVEYGCLRDRKFYDKIKGAVIFKDACEDRYDTLKEYLEAAKEKHENKVYYTTDVVTQAQYISLFSSEGIKIVALDRMLDTQFIHVIESDETDVKFIRVDADVADVLKEGDGEENETVKALFGKVSGNEKLKVIFQRLKDKKTPAMINIGEDSRRFDDMMKMYRMEGMGDMPASAETTLILNQSSPLTEKLTSLAASDTAAAEKLAGQIYSLALLAQRQLTAEELKKFLSDSYDMLLEL